MAAVAQALRIFKKVGDEIDPDELREQLGDAINDPDVQAQLRPGMIKGVASRLLTGAALRASWQFLIPSWGLTLIYLNFHFLARHFANRKGFTPLGSEWKMWRMWLGYPSFGLKYGEVIALVFLDALVIMILLAIATLLAMLAYAITHPCVVAEMIGYGLMAAIAGLGGMLLKGACWVLSG
jgi:hypothetical protein